MKPTVVVVGLGPGEAELVNLATKKAIEEIPYRFLRTQKHPSAHIVKNATSFDYLYETLDSFEQVYDQIVDILVTQALAKEKILYAVPGSAMVLETTVEKLRLRDEIDSIVIPSISFLDLAWIELGIDPISSGIRLIDGINFLSQAVGEKGPVIVGQCFSSRILSDIKLSVDFSIEDKVVVLQRLGLADQAVFELDWQDLDKSYIKPDHLTSIYIPKLGPSFGTELVKLQELALELRQKCQWDQKQTHKSLTRHLIEETYEVVEAIGEIDLEQGYQHLEEELGDVLYQVFFHSILAQEEGEFTLEDVAKGVREKLIKRHPHVFAGKDVVNEQQALISWEKIKSEEKNRDSLMDGIPSMMPALLYAYKTQRNAASVKFDWPDLEGALEKLFEELEEFSQEISKDDSLDRISDELGDVLFSVVNIARHLNIDPETCLRQSTHKFQNRFRSIELIAKTSGKNLSNSSIEELQDLWEQVKTSELDN